MKAIIVTQPGGPESLQLRDVPAPALRPGDVRIDVKATALNRTDLLQRKGAYPPPGTSSILGLECAGVVSEVHSAVAGVQPGDRVMALLAGGGYAEEVTCPARHTIPIPDNLSFEEAAAIPEAFLTAREALFTLGGISPGDTVLIHAAGGGVGAAAVQLASRHGAKVIGTTRTEAKRQVALSLGAQSVALLPPPARFVEAVREISEGAGAAVIVDFIGAALFSQHMECLASGGRLVVVGLLGGRETPLDLRKVLRKRLQILGLVMRTRSDSDKAAMVNRFIRESLPAFRDGSLKPNVGRVLPLAEADAAHRALEANEVVGKIVLKVGD